jgi:sirohydrochlorin ferrochelatase
LGAVKAVPTLTDQEQLMPDCQDSAAMFTPSHLATVAEVVELLNRYAAADRDLDAELERIRADVSSARRISQSTVTRLARLLDTSLMPGVRAKATFDALPSALRRAGIAQWARSSADNHCAAPRRVAKSASAPPALVGETA